MIIAGKKIAVTNDVTRNKESIIKALHQASAEKTDILLTPEGCLSGYTHEFNQEEVTPALKEVLKVAKELGVGLALGTCFYEDDGKCYNQVRFYTKEGEYLGFHSKVLRCCNLETKEGELNHYATTPLKTFDLYGQKVGGIICNDMWANPGCTPMDDSHVSQQLSDMGAKILFHAVNGGRDDTEWSDVIRNYHESNLRTRAKAGKVWIVTVDNGYPVHLKSAAPSGVIDPDGNWAIKAADSGESFFTFEIKV